TAHGGAATNKREQIAVAAETAAEHRAQAWEPGPAAQQQVRRPQRARGQDDALGTDGVSASGRVPRVLDGVSAALGRLEAGALTACPQVGAGSLRCREVRQIQRVLAAFVAADVALATQAAREARPPVQIGNRLGYWHARTRHAVSAGEADRQRRQKRREA